MNPSLVNIGIVGLGRWARVLTNAAKQSKKLNIIAGHSRSVENRQSFSEEFNIKTYDTIEEMLGNPNIEGVIITVPNEQHYPVAEKIAAAGKHVYTEKPISNTLEDGLRMERLQQKHDIVMVVGHSARLLKGVTIIKKFIDSEEIGRLCFVESNFSNERALTLSPDTWRWYRKRAPGGPLSQLAIHQFNILHYLGGEIDSVSSIASKLSPVGAEVDDQSMTTIKFKNGALGYVGSSWTSPGIFSVRAFCQNGLIHHELDFSSWDNPDNLHKSSSLYIQRGIDGFGLKEELSIPPGNMFLDELEIFAAACRSKKIDQLTAHDGNVAVAVVMAALKSIDESGRLISVENTLNKAKQNI
jgi:predicted dehydrogenase